MVIQKTAMYKILAIFLVLVLLIGSSVRVEAAEDFRTGTFEYNGCDISYQLVSGYTRYFEGGAYYTVTLGKPCYAVSTYYENSNELYVFLVSFDDTTYQEVRTNGAVKNKDFIYDYGLYFCYVGYDYSNPFVSSYRPTNDYMKLAETFAAYMRSDDFDDLLFSPNFVTNNIDNLFQLNNFQASIVDGNLVMKWDPFLFLPYKAMQNIYISYQFKQRPEGSAVSSNNHRNYLQDDIYSKISDYGLTIPLSDLNISEGYILSSVNAIPYFYIDDNLDNPTTKGSSSFVYFDADGVSSTPIIVEPDIEVDITEEDREQNLYYTIRNFFGGFFRNLTNALKNAIVPSSEELLALLTEMNDWFSERFGFIWYPFDLAIDIVAAFALGEPDSTITVPAFTINILGGIKLWDEFEADLDPIDFLKYVRFFTSTIMCCGTVSLAIRKWDEWIGGEH